MTWIDTRPRQTGKTTDLIRWAADEPVGGPPRFIACPNHRAAWTVHQQALSMGLSIRFPLTPGGFDGLGHSEVVFDQLAETLRNMFPRLTVVGAVW